MRDLYRRLHKAEKALNLSGEQTTVKIVCFGGELPPDRTHGDLIVQFVMFEGGDGK